MTGRNNIHALLHDLILLSLLYS